MNEELEITGGSYMRTSLKDMTDLAEFCSEGQRSIGMARVRERFTGCNFLTSPLSDSIYVLGAEKDVRMVRDSILNARKMKSL